MYAKATASTSSQQPVRQPSGDASGLNDIGRAVVDAPESPYEQTLTALTALRGSPITVTVTPPNCDWSAPLATMSGVLHRGLRRGLTLGSMPEDDDSEVVFFSLDAALTTGFAVGCSAGRWSNGEWRA